MDVLQDLDRKIGLAQQIMDRLNAGNALSLVLSSTRLLMSMVNDDVKVAFVDLLIHGITNVPYQPIPFKDPAYRISLGEIYMRICGMEDLEKLDVGEAIENMWRSDGIPKKTHISSLTVEEMECRKLPLDFVPGDSRDVLDNKVKYYRYYDRVKAILSSLRAYVFDMVSKLWLESIREKTRIELLGSDYMVVISKMNTLGTPVGDELLAAVDNLSKANPANWNAAALVCRNVIIKMANILLVVSETSTHYKLINGESIQIRADERGSKEKNRLLAYIDTFLKDKPESSEVLQEASKLVHTIYSSGSLGKRQIRHEELQKLIIDTFRFVDILRSEGLATITI